jgi:hypothetical protein
MQHIPDTSLIYYEKMPQARLVNLSEVDTKLFGHNIRTYRGMVDGTTGAVSPDKEAVQFYLFNHLAAIVKEKFTRHEVLHKWAADVMREYKQVVVQQGIRMVSYMALITARESRHMGGEDSSWWQKNIIAPYGDECYHFHHQIKSISSDTVVKVLMNSAPEVPIGNFYKALEYMFFHGGFSGGYGGKPWAMITQSLNQFLDGKISQEMLIDTAYTLTHNNGPMFNKGMLYNNYSGQFVQLLDIQRSGQIPEFVIEGSWGHLSLHQKKVFKAALEVIGSEFGEYVDWYKVEKLGAITNCSEKKKNQDKKYGKPTKKPKPALFNGLKAVEVGEFMITPTQSVPIYQRMEYA